jgi:hypothetical protein
MWSARNVVLGTLLLQLIPDGGGCSSRLAQNRHAGQRFTAIYSDWRRSFLMGSFANLRSTCFDIWSKELRAARVASP